MGNKQRGWHGVLTKHQTDADTPIALAGAPAWSQFQGFIHSEQSGPVVADLAQHRITLGGYRGLAIVTVGLDFSGTASKTALAEVRQGASAPAIAIEIERKLGTGGDVGSASRSVPLQLNGDPLTLWLQYDTAGSFVPHYVALAVYIPR